MLGAPGKTGRLPTKQSHLLSGIQLTRHACLDHVYNRYPILPGTELAQQVVEQGYVPADQDFTESLFLFSPRYPEDWLLQRVNQAIEACPTVVHAAEDPSGTPKGIRVFIKQCTCWD